MNTSFSLTRVPHTPQLLQAQFQALAAAARTTATTDSPVLLPLPQVEASPTTGFQQQLACSTGGAGAAPVGRGNTREATKREMDVGRGGPGKQSVANSDGWQWRKYGEKLVKGSPNPRSYYKCSHLGCAAKKIVERCDRTGDILSTEYKGDHTHPAPNAAKASRFKPKPRAEVPQVVGPVPASSNASKPNSLQALPGLLGVPALPLGLLPLSGMLPIPDALRSDFQGPHQSTYNGSNDDEDDDTDTSEPEPAPPLKAAPKDAPAARNAVAAIRRLKGGANSPSKRLDALAAYAEEAERELKSSSNSPEAAGPSSKRARTDAGGRTQTPTDDSLEDDDDGSTAAGASGVQRVLPASQLDDGYKWRKYGQKQVKGSPHPRSYYKCTHSGCTVRKHVEKSLHSDEMFVVTYEGAHSHRPPVPFRNVLKQQHVHDGSAEDDHEMDEAEQDSSQPTSPQNGARPVKSAKADLAQQLQQLQANLLASSVMQQAALSSMLPFLPYTSGLTPEALASLGIGADVLGVEGLNPLNLANTNNLADLTTLLRQTAQIDMAIAAHAQAIDAAAAAAAAGWDPLACLITPRPNAGSPAGQPGSTSKASKLPRAAAATTDEAA